MDKKWQKQKEKVFEIIEVGSDFDFVSRAYDIINVAAIIINLLVSILYTFDNIRAAHGTVLLWLETITVGFFVIDYVLRVWTAKHLHPNETEAKARRKYIVSFTGIVDLFSFLPYFLPVFFPAGTVAFRMLRIVRIFRLFRINAYYDSLSVITDVINGKKQQLISSVFIILVLMLASSLCMYSLEHEAQPEVFTNAFSGIWWAASTLLTVGYGDIYPITTMGKLFGIFITFLGVGMVAIPTGIISAGFVDQYSNIKRKTELGYEANVDFMKIKLKENDSWTGKQVSELQLPNGILMATVKRGEQVFVPRENTVLESGDRIVLAAEPVDVNERIHLKEIVLKGHNPWIGLQIKDLDISRHSIILLVKRQGKVMIPNGNMLLKEEDRVFLYTQRRISEAGDIEI